MNEEQSAHHTKNEIIIVKRRSDGDHDGHHGGVWKIAYADFMTAMMAFFLVMWLINAANDQTKASVASYFNPIKLVDQRPSDKGIKDDGHSTKQGELAQKSNKNASSASTGNGGEAGNEENATAGDKKQYSEADYFENPYSVLSEIAQQSGEKANISRAGIGGAQTSGPATGASGGKAYRDPFDPNFWSQQVQTVAGVEIAQKDVALPVPGSTASGTKGAAQTTGKKTHQASRSGEMAAAKRPGDKAKDGGNAEISAKTVGKAAAIGADKSPEAHAVQAMAGAGDAVAASMKAAASAEAAAAGKAAARKETKNEQAQQSSKKAKAEAEAKHLKEEIAKATGGVAGKLAEGISIKPAEGGVLVSITDRVDDGMFDVGSAVPSHDMVLAMQKIGGVLAKREGPVLIRGYTDARPYKGKGHDNWHLSTARAESAYYMLVRGGLDKTRVKQISGFADRHLLLPDEPFAPANRRIEILIGTKGAGQ